MPTGHRPTVLLVDDRAENLLALEAVLEPLDLELVRATSGEEALRHVLERDFALILLDIQMPGMDGFEVARHVRSRVRTRHIPVLFLTAIDTGEQRVLDAYAAGGVDYLAKPFHPEVLRAKVVVFAELDRRARLLHEATLREQELQREAEVRAAEMRATQEFSARLQEQAAELEETADALAVANEALAYERDRLARSEERYRLPVETAVDAIVTMDQDGVVVYANPAVEGVFGYRPEELVGRSLTVLIPEPLRAAHRAGVARYLATGQRRLPWRGLELQAVRADGREVVLELNFAEYAEGGRRFFTSVMRDVTERKAGEAERERLLVEAQAARLEAEAASRAKSDFLATMTHELRTPMNAILGYAELLAMGIRGPLTEGQRDDLGRISASGHHLLGLIDDILDTAKIEAGRLDVGRERHDAREVIHAALPLVMPQARAGGITLVNRCAADREHPYHGDESRVCQVLVNLLSNAVKFTGTGGEVSVEVEVVGDPGSAEAPEGGGPWTCFRVRDSGIGIAPEQLESIFRPFVQAETGHTRTYGGTGLGLTISRELARRMGGDLTVASRVGEGSVFTLWLPGG